MVVKIKKANVLLLTVLFVAGILASLLFLGQLVRNNINNTGSLVNSAKAFYSAESGLERALRLVRKEDVVPDYEDCFVSQSCSWQFLTDEQKELKIILPAEQSAQFDLFNAKNNLTAGAESISLQWENESTWLEATFYEFAQGDFKPDSVAEDMAIADLPVQKILLVGGDSILNFPQANKNYIVRIKALKEDAGNLRARFFSGENLRGEKLPLPNFLTIKTIGKVNENAMELSIVMPRRKPLFGLFDYVVFSEKSLKK